MNIIGYVQLLYTYERSGLYIESDKEKSLIIYKFATSL